MKSFFILLALASASVYAQSSLGNMNSPSIDTSRTLTDPSTSSPSSYPSTTPSTVPAQDRMPNNTYRTPEQQRMEDVGRPTGTPNSPAGSFPSSTTNPSSAPSTTTPIPGTP